MPKISWDILGKDNVLQYSHEGVKLKRTAHITGLPSLPMPGQDCSGTLYQLLTGSVPDFPLRGNAHPSIVIATEWGGFAHPEEDDNAFCADVIHFRFLDSNKVEAEIEYSVLNGLTQEPSEDFDKAPAWLTYASSVQQAKTNVDYQGNQLLCQYKGAYAIKDNFGTIVYPGGGASNGPQSLTTAEAQWPNILMHFQRRMTTRQSPIGVLSCINASPITIDGHPYQKDELLIVRYDFESLDGGVSFIMTCDAQYRATTPPTTYAPAIPGWQVGDYYRVQSGFAWDTANNWQVAGVRDVPPDAYANVFQIQSEFDMSSLNLGNE